MFRKKSQLTFILCMLVLFASSSVSYANYHGLLESAKTGEYNAYKAAQREFDKLQDCQTLLGI